MSIPYRLMISIIDNILIDFNRWAIILKNWKIQSIIWKRSKNWLIDQSVSKDWSSNKSNNQRKENGKSYVVLLFNQKKKIDHSIIPKLSDQKWSKFHDRKKIDCFQLIDRKWSIIDIWSELLLQVSPRYRLYYNISPSYSSSNYSREEYNTLKWRSESIVYGNSVHNCKRYQPKRAVSFSFYVTMALFVLHWGDIVQSFMFIKIN